MTFGKNTHKGEICLHNGMIHLGEILQKCKKAQSHQKPQKDYTAGFRPDSDSYTIDPSSEQCSDHVAPAHSFTTKHKTSVVV